MQVTGVPQHIGIIMDGNRRWAKRKHLPIFMGHREGKKRVEPLVDFAARVGITHLTFWAFSTENWQREEQEVQSLLQVFRESLQDPMIERLQKNGVKVNILGDLSAFPHDIQKGIEHIVIKSKDNTRITVNFALNYGGRQEILHAINSLMKVKQAIVTEEIFAEYLYTTGQPNPDLIIRTGGAQRLSGFLPWQSVYSELYFTETFWPDFDEQEFEKAIKEYQKRQRRFGK